MNKSAELDREPITVDEVEYTVTEIVWNNGGRSFDVFIEGGLLTEDESLDHYPTEEDIRRLYNEDDADTFPSTTCGCGHEIIRTPEGWQHNVAPWFWGDDHDPQVD